MNIDMKYMILNREQLPGNESTREFEGIQFWNTEVSFIWVEMPPGGQIRLHKHPYQEIFIVQEGVSTFVVDSDMLEARTGQMIIVPANVPHKFINASDRQLKQIDIHVSREFVTDWLED